MKALRYDGRLKLVQDAPVPRREHESIVEVLWAGICNTDLEIVKGYAGFRGTLGHEFVGRVVDSPEASLIGRRVVGEINVGCNTCRLCLAGDSRHCEARSVLGIKDRDGAFAEFLSLPARNLIPVPDSLPDEAAVFVEPVAAARQALEQVSILPSSSVAVIGDGKLAQLIIRVLAQTGCELTAIGKHEEKLALARIAGAASRRVDELTGRERFNVVVEASGSPSGLPLALKVVRPRGVVVLKSTHHGATALEMSPVVVNEVTIVGSRCGRFGPAIELLASGRIDVRPLITERFSITEAIGAFERASSPSSMKVLLQIAEP